MHWIIFFLAWAKIWKSQNNSPWRKKAWRGSGWFYKWISAFIFEIRSNEDEFAQDLAQLLSFGIAVRHSHKLEMYLHLILITPGTWKVLTLPPIGVELGSPVCYSVPIFTNSSGSIFFNKNYFIWFIRYMIQLARAEGKQPLLTLAYI